MCKAGTLIWDEGLVQSVSEPRAHHLDLESYKVYKVKNLYKKVIKFFRSVHLQYLVIVPLLHHVEDPEVVIDPLGDCVHVVSDKLNVAFSQIHTTSSHVDLLCLDNYIKFSKCYDTRKERFSFWNFVTANPSSIPVTLPSSNEESFPSVFSKTVISLPHRRCLMFCEVFSMLSSILE